MRRIRRNVHGLAGAHDGLRTAEGRLDLPLEKNERLLEIVPMRRRSTARWNVHVDDAEVAGSVVASKQDRVRVTDESDVRQLRVAAASEHERARETIGGEWRI